MVERRTLLTGGAALGATAWAAPSVLTFDRLAAAVGSCVADVPVASDGAVLIGPPPNMNEGTPGLDSNTNSFVWLESEAEILDNDLIVNRTVAGSFNGGSNENAVIPAGTEIASYMIHGDRLDDNGFLQGTVTFPNAMILGLIYRTTQLNASNFLSSPTTVGNPQAMETGDTMILDLTPGANSISFRMRFGPALDNIRVIISCS